MKTFLATLLTGLMLVSVASAQSRRIGEDMEKTNPEPTADYMAIFEEGRKLYSAGRLDEAANQLDVVLAKYPHYQPAVKLRNIVAIQIRNDPSREVRERLERIVIPRVNFKDALLESALDFLRDESRRLDRSGKGVNLVVLLPDEIKKRRVTLDLIDARASDVLRFLAEGAGFRYRIERSAVVLSASEPGGAPAGSATTTAATEPDLPNLPPPIPGAP